MKIIKKRALNRSFGGDATIAFFLIIMGIFMALPLVYAISSSLKPLDELWIFPPRFFVQNPTLKNFTDLFTLMSDSWVPFSRYIFNTLFISVSGTVGHVLISSLCAYALSKHDFYGRKIIFSVIVLSLMFSGAVTSIPNYLIISKFGWMNTYLAVIVPAFSGSLGLYLMKQFMDTMIPASILESARLDGAGEFRIFFKIVMPIVKPAWLTLIVFSFQGLWNMGASIYIQDEKLKTINYAISQILAGGIARAGAGAAAAVVMMIMPVLVFVITQSNIVETMASSGIKE
jgi:ABC-type glycerol-3-phosphate transport system permease component